MPRPVGTSGAAVFAYNAIASQESDNLASNSGPGCAPLIGYSELMNNTGLGTLPCNTQLLISANGKTIQAGKCDSGGGSSFNPQMGLYPRVSEYLFGTRNGGEFHVVIQRADGKAINIVNGSATNPVNGVRAPGGTAGLGGSGTLLNSPSPSQQGFTVGDVSNPNEDFWSAINRLAQERYWYAFSDGETFYLADGPDLMRQTPAMDVDRINDSDRISHLDFTYDNTAYQFAASHRKRNRPQRRTGLAKVTSPTEANLEIISAIDETRAGDVVFLSSCGPGDGRWLVGDCRRSAFQVTSEVSLVTALSPLREDQIAGVGKNSALLPSSGTSANIPAAGLRAAVVAAAKSAVNITSGYAQTRPYPSSLAACRTSPTDCSGFATLCYKEAGAPDPNGSNYNGQGFTGTLEKRGRPTPTPQPGDLAFWSSPDHVAVMVDSTNIIEWGSPPGPRALTVSQENGFHASFLGYRSYL